MCVYLFIYLFFSPSRQPKEDRDQFERRDHTLTCIWRMPPGPSTVPGELSNTRSRYKDHSPTLGKKSRAAMSSPATCSSLLSFRLMSPGGSVWSAAVTTCESRLSASPSGDNFHCELETGWFQGGWRTATDATSGHDFQNKTSQTLAALVYSKPLEAVSHTALRLVCQRGYSQLLGFVLFLYCAFKR